MNSLGGVAGVLSTVGPSRSSGYRWGHVDLLLLSLFVRARGHSAAAVRWVVQTAEARRSVRHVFFSQKRGEVLRLTRQASFQWTA